MLYQLPPVGNPVCLSHADKPDVLSQVFGSTYEPHYFASGTAALAAAITAASRLKPVDAPEVIVPAYGCPDLISAAVFAGVKPVLVDLEADRPWIDLEQLSARISTQTVAIVVVNLFGISERMEQLRPLAEQAEIVLIEDSAQAFPSGKEQDIWTGDLVVLSFGRGKPVSLLGGGAVLCREGAYKALYGLLPCEREQPVNAHQQLTFQLKAALYNRMISPRLYWLPQAMPFLHLGETRYRPLTSIKGMDRLRLSMLPANVKVYRGNSLKTQEKLVAMLGDLDLEVCGITDLPNACKIAEGRRLLRYPLLVEPGTRDQLYDELHRFGLGPSLMYPTVLPKISGLGSILQSQGVFPAASSFAERLLTLPTHQQVGQADIAKMRQVLGSH
jgi:dTDP-4-amino-4,6-dideoxygalactose transaminase